MNQKHIACAVVAILIAVLFQITQTFQNNSAKMKKEADAAAAAENSASANLAKERSSLAELTRQSADLINFLRTWEPEFARFNSAQSAEVSFSMQVRESGLVNLSQSYQTIPIKGNASIPSALRARLVFEDDYIKLVNRLGRLESSMPVLRVSDVRVTRGARPSDIRLELLLDLPLINK